MSAMGDMGDSERARQAPAGDGAYTDDDWKIAKYVEEVELYDKETQKWDRQAKKIIKRYKDDRGSQGNVDADQARRYNILWTIIQNLKPSLWARNPKPDIQRRFKDADPVGRVTSDVLERAVSFFTETDHFYNTNQQCVMDYCLTGRGTLWIRYVPTFKAAMLQSASPDATDVQITDDVGPGDANDQQAEAPQVIDWEEVVPDYVHRADFGHNICRTWDEVWLVYRIVYLSRPELRERFKNLTDAEIAAIPLDYKKMDLSGKVIDDGVSKAVIYEAWDKVRRCAVWFHKAVPKALDLRPDPLRLQDFFPCPKPLFANLANDNLIPVPDYVEYQDQASELDLLTARIAMMTRCLKVVGIYDASAEGLNRMFNEGTENELIPVQQWALFAEKGGMAGAMQLLDIKGIAAALLDCYAARDKVLQDLDNITGMADIVRGQTDPNETASAQKLKAGYANQRIADRQRDVQMFARQTIRIMTDIICNHFQLDTIKRISGVRLLTEQEKQAYQQASAPSLGHNGGPPLAGAGQPVAPPAPPPLPPHVSPDQMQDMMDAPTWEEVNALIHDNAMRSFRIDIETDSTIKADQEADKASRIEFVKAIGEYLSAAIPAAQNTPELMPFLCEGLMFLARGFPVGKQMEGYLASALQKLEKAAANPQPKPDPEMAKVQGALALEDKKTQNAKDLEMAKIQAKKESDISEAQQQTAVNQHLNELEYQRNLQELAAKERMAEADRRHEEVMLRIKTNTESLTKLAVAHTGAAASIEVARIGAEASDGAEAETREASGEQT